MGLGATCEQLGGSAGDRCGRQNSPPKASMSLEPVNMSRDAADVILLRTLTVISPGYLGGPSVTTRVLESRDPFPAVIEAVLGAWRWNVDGLPKLERQGNQFSQSLQRGTQSC